MSRDTGDQPSGVAEMQEFMTGYSSQWVTYHQEINGKYRIKLERAASTKGVDGFVVEANGDTLEEVQGEAARLYEWAKNLTPGLTSLKPEESKGAA